MTTEKWVPCTEELAENPHKVKAWKVNGRTARFLTYDKGHDFPIIARIKLSENVTQAPFHIVECLIEVPIQEEYLTYHNCNGGIKQSYPELIKAQIYRGVNCTHIVKLTFDGKDFKAECVWTKEST